MKDLNQIQSDLKKLLTKGIPDVLKALRELFPDSTDLINKIVVLEGKLHDTNKKRLKATLTDEQLQVNYNQIREEILILIDSLTDPSLLTESDQSEKVEKAESGELLYKIPEQMILHQEEKCVVRIALSEDEIIKNIELDDNVALRKLSRVSNLMQVVLVDPNSDAPFEIRTINEAEQLIYDDAYTEWIFYVKPLKQGTFPLVIKVSVIEMIFNKERKRELIFEEEINITTETPQEDSPPPVFKKSGHSFPLSGSEDIATDNPGESGPSPSKFPFPPRQILGIGLMLIVASVAFFSIINNEDQFYEDEAMYSTVITEGSGHVITEPGQAIIQVENNESRIVTYTRTPATSNISVQPAEYDVTTVTRMTTQASTRINCIDAQYETRTIQVIRGEFVKAGISTNPVYKDTTFKELIQPATVERKLIPAEYEMVYDTIIVAPERMEIKASPAVFTVIKDTLHPGGISTEILEPSFEFTSKIITKRPAYSKWVLVEIEGCMEQDPRKCVELEQQTQEAIVDTIHTWHRLPCPEDFEYVDSLCVKTINYPPTIVEREIVSKPATKEEVLVPAKIEISRSQILVRPTQTIEEVVPAKYHTYEVQIIENRDQFNEGEIITQYGTEYVQVQRKPKECTAMEIPAEYNMKEVPIQKPIAFSEILHDEVLDSIILNVPSKTYTLEAYTPPKTSAFVIDTIQEVRNTPVNVQVLKKPSKKVIRQLQETLKEGGYYQGTTNGILNVQSLIAMSNYQNRHALPVGQIDKTTLDHMNISY